MDRNQLILDLQRRGQFEPIEAIVEVGGKVCLYSMRAENLARQLEKSPDEPDFIERILIADGLVPLSNI